MVILDFIFNNLFTFIGTLIIMSSVGDFLTNLLSTYMKNKNKLEENKKKRFTTSINWSKDEDGYTAYHNNLFLHISKTIDDKYECIIMDDIDIVYKTIVNSKSTAKKVLENKVKYE